MGANFLNYKEQVPFCDGGGGGDMNNAFPVV